MPYSNFTLEQVREQFQLILDETQDLFANVAEVPPSPLLTQILAEYLPLAIDINSEKARSELIIAPVLVEVRRLTQHQVSLFSGREFNVDAALGLTGFCDFILSRAREQLRFLDPLVELYPDPGLTSYYRRCCWTPGGLMPRLAAVLPSRIAWGNNVQVNVFVANQFQ